MFSAESTILLCFHSVRMSFFVFFRVVVTILALCTCQCYFCAHNFHLHIKFFCFFFMPKAFATYLKKGIKKRPTSIANLIYHNHYSASTTFSFRIKKFITVQSQTISLTNHACMNETMMQPMSETPFYEQS